MQSVGFLTSGGCAAGLDAFIQTFPRLLMNDYEVYGFLNGWEGLAGKDNPNFELISEEVIAGLSRSGGTYVRTSRLNPFPKLENPESKFIQGQMHKNYWELVVYKGLQGIVIFGGDDSLSVAANAHDKFQMNVIGVPKTMDLDLNETDYSVGFHSYCEAVCRNAVPGFIETLNAHSRVGVLEVFGRNSGFVAAQIGLASDACFIAIPEMEVDLDLLKARVEETYKRDGWALVVVSEAIKIEAADVSMIDQHGNELLSQRRVGEFTAAQIEALTSIETRSFQASHPFRGVPTSYDAIVGIRLGIKAAEMVWKDDWNKLIIIQGDAITNTDDLWAFKPRRVITPETWWWEAVNLRNHGKI